MSTPTDLAIVTETSDLRPGLVLMAGETHVGSLVRADSGWACEIPASDGTAARTIPLRYGGTKPIFNAAGIDGHLLAFSYQRFPTVLDAAIEALARFDFVEDTELSYSDFPMLGLLNQIEDIENYQTRVALSEVKRAVHAIPDT